MVFPGLDLGEDGSMQMAQDMGSGGPPRDMGSGGPVDMGAGGMDMAEEDMSVAEDMPAAGMNIVERGGQVVFEAERFNMVDDNGTTRSWYAADDANRPMPDPDPERAGASGGSYMEALPDDAVNQQTPGDGPRVSYDIEFTTTGTYYVHVRGWVNDDNDNTVHVGVDGMWPASGTRIQWCAAWTGSWVWSSHIDGSSMDECGMADSAQIQIDTPGMHTVSFAMREDGFEFDKVVLTTQAGFTPDGQGPPETLGP